LFSADVADEANEVGKAMTTLVNMFNYLLLPFSEWLEKLPLPHTRRLNHARNTLNSIIFQFIDENRRSGEDKGDLLSMLLAARDEMDGSTMSDDQVRDEALTLFLAGHETTAVAMTWTWYLLSQNPEVEEKLHEEVRGLADKGGNPTGMEGVDLELENTLAAARVSACSFGFEDISKFRYTEAVFAESMRLFPPAWAVGRLAVDDHQFGSFEVPKGSLVLASPWVTHRDPRFWNEPEKFRPERWLQTSVKEAGQQFHYFPFGAGVRRCIGESFAWTEGILLLATIARKWKLELLADQRIGLQPMITLRPKFGMRMQIRARA
jgi:cytochrome P450